MRKCLLYYHGIHYDVVSVTVIAAANIYGGVVIAVAMAALVIVVAAQVFTNNRLECTLKRDGKYIYIYINHVL